MKGDFSRLRGVKAKTNHYNAVWKQQGRVQLDSDWNELIEIVSHQRKTRTEDTIGTSGAPIHHSGFQIMYPGGDSPDLLFSTGRFYAGGVLCETSPAAKIPITGFGSGNRILIDDMEIEGIPFVPPGSGEPDQWVQLTTKENPDGILGRIIHVEEGILRIDRDISSLLEDHHPHLRRLLYYSRQTDFPTAPVYSPAAGRTDLVYLDVWERHITPIEDPELREVALGGPDTDTRSRVIAQVKVLKDIGDVACIDEIEAWNYLLKVPDGRLTTGLTTPDTSNDPCQLGESGGFTGLENRLYRVEIHAIDDEGNALFKWSRDNAAFAYGVQEIYENTATGFKIDLQGNGKDELLKIKPHDWIEISGDETDLDTEKTGTLVKVLEVAGTVLTIDRDVSAYKNETSPKIRRWEISDQRPHPATQIVPGTGFQLEDGIEIKFSGTEFNIGDYWVFSARTLTGEIEILEKAPPLGITHHYCKLALLSGEADGTVSIEDCRPEFHPLTELPDTGGCCTVNVGEDEAFRDIQRAVDALKGGPGEVCIKPGVYEIDTPIIVRGNDITIKGCGGTPIIRNNAGENEGIIFQIEDAQDIVIHDLRCISNAGSRVISVKNSLFFNLYNCMLVGAGDNDLAGVVSCSGLTVNTRIADNIILGTTGIRYDRMAEQEISMHLHARVEKNLLFVLKTGILQYADTVLAGCDIIDNLILGFDLELMARSFFPQLLFNAAKKSKLYPTDDIKRAEEKRNNGAEWRSVSRSNTIAVHNLNNLLRVTATEAKSHASATQYETTLAAGTQIFYPTVNPVIHLLGTLVDGNITDNILLGDSGILVASAFEFTIANNIIEVQGAGIMLQSFIGGTIKNNFVHCQTFAISCLGQLIFGLTVSNNRMYSQQYGISFRQKPGVSFQNAFNIQIDSNIITAMEVGIEMADNSIYLADFTAVDNSITGCKQAGILLRVYGSEDQTSFERDISLQRVLQRNSFVVQGTGIDVNLPGCRLLDNDINHNMNPGNDSTNSRGIIVGSSECTVSGNTIQANIDPNGAPGPYGGIYINLGFNTAQNVDHQQIHIRHNRILGGMGNGIEIGSNINGLAIEENQILDMGLNGIAVQNQVDFVNSLVIKGNHIRNCHRLIASGVDLWWKYAGIVLTSTRKTQIIGNVICDNGIVADQGIDLPGLGAFYAKEIKEITISNNQFMNNGVPGIDNFQAVIHIPIRENVLTDIQANSDVQITNNIVKAVAFTALYLGSYVRFKGLENQQAIATDHKIIISNNQFESSFGYYTVLLGVSHSIFSGNYVSNNHPKAPSVYIGYGVDVALTGNITKGPIISQFGNNQLIESNLEIEYNF